MWIKGVGGDEEVGQARLLYAPSTERDIVWRAVGPVTLRAHSMRNCCRLAWRFASGRASFDLRT